MEDISKEEYERIKKYIKDFSYIDLIIWRNEMLNGGNINNSVYSLLNKEIYERASIGLINEKRKSK